MKVQKTTRPASPSDDPILAPPSPHCAGIIPCCDMQRLRHASPSVNSMPPCARSGPSGLRRQVLAGLEEFDLRPPLLGQPEIHPRWREVHQLAGMIDGKIVVGLFPE